MKKPIFTDFGERLILNFVNTVQSFRGKTIDLIDSPSAVIGWLGYMEQRGQISSMQYERLLEDNSWDLPLLGEFRRRVREFVEDSSPTNILHFAAYLAETMSHSPLTFTVVANPKTLHWDLVPLPQCGGALGLLSVLSYNGMQMITTDALKRVKKCDNPTCLAYFVNNSGKRKWCSMETCGNRRKSFRHYQRYHPRN